MDKFSVFRIRPRASRLKPPGRAALWRVTGRSARPLPHPALFRAGAASTRIQRRNADRPAQSCSWFHEGKLREGDAALGVSAARGNEPALFLWTIQEEHRLKPSPVLPTVQDRSSKDVPPECPIHDQSNCKSDRVRRPEPFHQGFPPNRGCHADTVPSDVL